MISKEIHQNTVSFLNRYLIQENAHVGRYA